MLEPNGLFIKALFFSESQTGRCIHKTQQGHFGQWACAQRKVIFLFGVEQKMQQPMVEHIHKVNRRMILIATAGQKHFGENQWQGSARPSQAHQRGIYLVRAGIISPNGLNISGRKSQCDVRLKADRVVTGPPMSGVALPLCNALQQTGGLKKTKLKWVLLELGDQIRHCQPAMGDQRRRTSPLRINPNRV